MKSKQQQQQKNRINNSQSVKMYENTVQMK